MNIKALYLFLFYIINYNLIFSISIVIKPDTSSLTVKNKIIVVNKIIKELNRVYIEDQLIRKYLIEININEKNSDLIKLLNQKDKLNLYKVTYILDKYGWLGKDIVGYYANKALFISIQHADNATQKKYLPLLIKAVKNGSASGEDLALLIDRDAVYNGKPQIYGSQLYSDINNKNRLYPIYDETNVNKRRLEIGLDSLESYLKYFNTNLKESKSNNNSKQIKIQFNYIFFGLFFFYIILNILLFNKKKHSNWYWLYNVFFLLIMYELYLDNKHSFSNYKLHNVFWVAFLMSKYFAILIFNYLFLKLVQKFRFNNIKTDLLIITISFFIYYYILRNLFQNLFLKNCNLTFYTIIIEPIFYLTFYIIINYSLKYYHIKKCLKNKC